MGFDKMELDIYKCFTPVKNLKLHFVPSLTTVNSFIDFICNCVNMENSNILRYDMKHDLKFFTLHNLITIFCECGLANYATIKKMVLSSSNMYDTFFNQFYILARSSSQNVKLLVMRYVERFVNRN